MSSINITDEKKQKEREFSLEKIASAIHCGNMISSIRNKYIDPLIIRRKNLLPKIKRKIKLNGNNDPFSLEKILYHEFLKKNQKQKQNIENEKDKGIQTRNNTVNKLLPIIPNRNDKQKLFNNKYCKYSDSLLITSGMFKQKEYCKDPEQKVKLGCIINLKFNGGEQMNMYPKIESINKINEKYNLQLDLNHLNSNSLTVKKHKKLTKKGLMNKLFNKYATSSTTGINVETLNGTNNSNKKKRRKTKKTFSLLSRNNQNDIVKANTLTNSESDNITVDFVRKDSVIDDGNTFITKLSVDIEPKKENPDNIKQKRIKLKKLKLFENNKNIINYDQKVTIDCLFSRVKENIEQDKLVYNHIDKTTFELQKEPTYKKVKKFESIIDKIIKTQE